MEKQIFVKKYKQMEMLISLVKEGYSAQEAMELYKHNNFDEEIYISLDELKDILEEEGCENFDDDEGMDLKDMYGGDEDWEENFVDDFNY